MKNIAHLIFAWFSFLSFIFSYPLGRNSTAAPYWDHLASNFYQNATMSINSSIATNSHQLANTESLNYDVTSNLTTKKFKTKFEEMKKLDHTNYCNCPINESITNTSRAYSNFCSQPITFFLKGFKIFVYPIIDKLSASKIDSEVGSLLYRTTLFDRKYLQAHNLFLRNESENTITELVENRVKIESKNIAKSDAAPFSTTSWTKCEGGNQRKTAQGGLQTSSTVNEFLNRRFAFFDKLNFSS